MPLAVWYLCRMQTHTHSTQIHMSRQKFWAESFQKPNQWSVWAAYNIEGDSYDAVQVSYGLMREEHSSCILCWIPNRHSSVNSWSTFVRNWKNHSENLQLRDIELGA